MDDGFDMDFGGDMDLGGDLGGDMDMGGDLGGDMDMGGDLGDDMDMGGDLGGDLGDDGGIDLSGDDGSTDLSGEDLNGGFNESSNDVTDIDSSVSMDEETGEDLNGDAGEVMDDNSDISDEENVDSITDDEEEAERPYEELSDAELAKRYEEEGDTPLDKFADFSIEHGEKFTAAGDIAGVAGSLGDSSDSPKPVKEGIELPPVDRNPPTEIHSPIDEHPANEGLRNLGAELPDDFPE